MLTDEEGFGQRVDRQMHLSEDQLKAATLNRFNACRSDHNVRTVIAAITPPGGRCAKSRIHQRAQIVAAAGDPLLIGRDP